MRTNRAPRFAYDVEHVANAAERDVAGLESAIESQLFAPEVDELPRVHEQHDGARQRAEVRASHQVGSRNTDDVTDAGTRRIASRARDR